MKKLVGLVVLVACLMLASNVAFAGNFCWGNSCKTDGNVMDSNEGSEGDILIYDCRKGNTDVGEWVDPESVPELKGEKGDTGDRGPRGFPGKDGTDGIDGEDGIDGQEGERGPQGDQGIQGEKGDRGRRGKQGIEGEKGDKPAHTWEDTSLSFENPDGTYGDLVDLKGEKGDKGEMDKRFIKQINNNTSMINSNTNRISNLENRVGALEETQYVVEGQVRILDTKKWEVKPFVRYSFTRSKVDVVGVKVTFKFGKSYEERKIEELEAKLNALGIE